MRGELALRVLRLKSNRRSDTRKLIDRVFGDDDLRTIVAAAVNDEFALDERAGDWQGFFSWLIENQDAIIAFIQMILSLFSDQE